MTIASRNHGKSPSTAIPQHTYAWVAHDSRGTLVRGEMTARSAALVRAHLRRRGLQPRSVRSRSRRISGLTGRRIRAADIALFSRQLATMLAAGIPLVQAFDIVIAGQPDARFAMVLGQIRHDIRNGSSLHAALTCHQRHFDSLYCNLVKAGEMAGVLDHVLATLATHRERNEVLKGRVRKALLYPAVVLAVAILVCALLLVVVVPVFEDIFHQAGAMLPLATRIVVGLSQTLQHHGLTSLGAFVLVIAGFTLARRHSERFNHGLDRFLLHLPVLGPILNKSAVARFARTLGITVRAGMPLTDALDTVAGATGNRIHDAAVKRIRDDVAAGQALHLALHGTGRFSPMVEQMVSVGEESGALDAMLLKIADVHEEQVNNAVDSLSTLLEPVIMIMLGILIGGMVIALYLPVFQLAGTF